LYEDYTLIWFGDSDFVQADSQHIVDYGGRDGLAFYALTRLAPSGRGLTAVPPLQALAELEALGLPVVKFQTTSIADESERASVCELF
jgi:hypothetical protein